MAKASSAQPARKRAKRDESDDSADDAASYAEEGTAESSDSDGAEGELEVDSSDPDGSPAPAPVKRKAPAKAKKDGTPKSKPAKGKESVDGKNTRVVKQPVLHPAPKSDPNTSLILPTTLDFLRQLTIPENNDRDWFKARDPIYRHAETNWRSFIQALVPVASRADWSLPELPVKDLVGRIYRDVRFSKDKRPYKTNLAVNMTRTGRKGPFAGYYFHIAANDRSFFGAGKWEMQSSDLATVRHSIVTDSQPLRKILATPKFAKLFGKAEPGTRSSVFGRDDELKNSPKIPGIDKKHPDIDLLKLKSIVVDTHFTDAQVLSPDFLETLFKVYEIAAPFVQCINEMIMPTPRDDELAAAKDASDDEEVPVESENEEGQGDEGDGDGDEEEGEEE